jgi:hypothetical protein
MEERRTAGTSPASVVVRGPASRTWRRELGALAWAALEELALTARHDDQGWASPVGIRFIATGIGTTDAAALQAIAALARAGLVALEPVSDRRGHRNVGYRLYLPQGLELRHSPEGDDGPASGLARSHLDRRDGPLPRRRDDCPSSQDKDRCPIDQDTVLSIGGELGSPDKRGSGWKTDPPPHHRSRAPGTQERP